MKLPKSASARTLRPGLSVLELTVVILVLTLLTSVLFIGVSVYKSGSDRASCVLNIRNLQNAVRSYSNMHGYTPGQSLPLSNDLRGELIGEGGFVENSPVCPGGGSYQDLGNRIPGPGELYLSCSLADKEKHVPNTVMSW